MFLINIHAKTAFFIEFSFSTVQENLVTIFFKMQKYLLRFFLICAIFFDFFNKFAKKL